MGKQIGKHGIAIPCYAKSQELFNILPPEIRKEYYKNIFVAGGAIYSLANNKEVHDYDLYIKDKEYLDILCSFFEENSKELGAFITENAITWKDIQIIKVYYGTPEYVISTFDFMHCKGYYDIYKGVVYNPWFIYTDELKFNEFCNHPTSAFFRIPKFLSRGMTIEKPEIRKILQSLKDNGFTKEDEKTMENLGIYEQVDYNDKIVDYKEEIFDKNIW